MMDIYSVTPQMERHMTTIEFFGSNKGIMHSVEEDEAANKFLESGKGDFDDSFVYDELDEDSEENEARLAAKDVEDELIELAKEDIIKKLTSTSQEIPVKRDLKPKVRIIKAKSKEKFKYGGSITFEF